MEKINIICIDDQADVLNAVVKDLAELESHFIVEGCDSAADCEELLEEIDANGELLALVISDHVMPGKSGVEMLTELAADPRFQGTKKILLTGQATQKDTIHAINQANINHYFEKPWDKDALVNEAKKLVTEFIFEKGFNFQDFQGVIHSETLFKYLK